MDNNFIQLKKDNILRFGIRTAEGEDTGEFLEFDVEDVELPLRINKSDIMHKKNLQGLKMGLAILEKKEDKKGKYLLSWKEEEQIRLINDFYNKEIDALDLFLGEGGTRKLLNGRKPYFTMYNDIAEYLEPIMPKIRDKSQNIVDVVIKKYDNSKSDVME